jgi:hypothetical protein
MFAVIGIAHQGDIIGTIAGGEHYQNSPCESFVLYESIMLKKCL